MNSFLKVFSFALVMGAANAGGPPRHHHHHKGYTIVETAPVITKSAPIYVSKSVSPAVTYAEAPAVSYAAGPAVAYAAGPSVSYAAAPAVSYGPAVSYAAAPLSYVSQAPQYYATQLQAGAPVGFLSSGKPKVYQHSIPAAAVRNIETVMVTKTITPVVTKTTTHHTSAEPALSVGHVQGYSHGAVGQAKLAPVSFDTQYTTYANPTVGINGPVVYSGAALAAQPVVKSVAAVPAPAAVVAEPVYKTVEPAAVYKTAAVASVPAHTHGTYAVYPGSSLSLASYGLDAYSVPATNFLEVRSGKPVFAAYGHSHAHVHKK